MKFLLNAQARRLSRRSGGELEDSCKFDASLAKNFFFTLCLALDFTRISESPLAGPESRPLSLASLCMS